MLIPSALGALITNAELLYCGWLSFKALESGRNDDDTRWLTFWFVYTLFAFAKAVLDYVAFIIPFYTETNIAVVTYLAFGGGAKVCYEVLKPILKEHEAMIDQKLAEAAEKAKQLQSEATSMAAAKAEEYKDTLNAAAQAAVADALKKGD